MKKIDDLKSEILHDTIVLLGKFDGFHVGHQKLLEEALRLKAEHAAVCPQEPWSVVVFTFDVYPGQVLEAMKEDGADPGVSTLLKSHMVRTIQTHEERLLDQVSDEADYLVEFPFNKKTMSMAPEVFVQDVLVGKLGVHKIVCGYDFRFGKDRKGSVKMLQELGMQYGFDVLVVPKVMIRLEASGKDTVQPQEISTTLIREEIRQGHMEQAAAMLGRPFYIIGEVVKGKQLGRTIGFPTVNQQVPDHKILPPDGVYATKVSIPDAPDTDREQTRLWGVTNLGRRPTFDDGEERTVETFLLDFHGDLYGREIKTEFLHFIRPEQKFESVPKLQEQMNRDLSVAKTYFKEYIT